MRPCRHYYNCLDANGNNFGGIADMINAFVSLDLVGYLQSLSEAQKAAPKDQGCMGLLTPSMNNMLLRDQERFERNWEAHHPEGQ